VDQRTGPDFFMPGFLPILIVFQKLQLFDHFFEGIEFLGRLIA
jgi:hypothetical protein